MTSAIPMLDTRQEDARSQLARLRNQLSPRGEVVSRRGREKTIEVFGEPLTPVQVVERICRDVQQHGIEAAIRYTRQLDGVDLSAESLRVAPETLARAHQQVDPQLLHHVRHIREQIFEFQTAIRHSNQVVQRTAGVRLEQRYVPLERVGICVPGGAAAYPSSVLMAAVPAQAAGVAQLAVVAPPTEFGSRNQQVLAVCHELGIEEVYQIGGAQAVAALAYGLAGMQAVDKIVGPGNLFVTLAKKYVYGQVDIDSLAGPSEVVVIADETADPAWVAADLLAQAEHAPGASLLVTWCASLRDAVQEALQNQVNELDRADLTRQSLAEFGCLILVRDEEEACEVTNQLAPEHLHVQARDAERLTARLHNAGAVFVGRWTPVALGDYVAGPSHVLPTSGTARWASGLSANSFLRSHSVIHYDVGGLRADAPAACYLAEQEGLTAHRDSMTIRLPERD